MSCCCSMGGDEENYTGYSHNTALFLVLLEDSAIVIINTENRWPE